LKFGAAVGEIVAGCSDTDRTPKPPWRKPKEEYIAHFAVGVSFHPTSFGFG
jgi:GTP pyrophosphokinase